MPHDIDAFLSLLATPYRQRLPLVDQIFAAMQTSGLIPGEEVLENDHIAIRSLGVPGLGIEGAAQAFLHFGYQRRDHYYFEAKKLDAFWFSPPRDDLPRVFISELRVNELSAAAQRIINNYVAEASLSDTLATRFSTLPWRTPTQADYLRLAEESEYASWTLCHGYAINHLTIAVHDLPKPHNDIETFTRFIATQGIDLNEAGGLVKVSGDGLLLQSSTKAPAVDFRFADGSTSQIPGAYVEFAERRPLNDQKPAISRADRREGFETANADKIFESTFRQSS